MANDSEVLGGYMVRVEREVVLGKESGKAARVKVGGVRVVVEVKEGRRERKERAERMGGMD